MKLFYITGSCSLSVHMILAELAMKEGVDYAIEKYHKQTGLTDANTQFKTINPKGKVPCLTFDNEVLTEAPAILQFLADRFPGANLAPENGSMARVHLQSWLNFCASEYHKSFTPLFTGSYKTGTAEDEQRALTQIVDTIKQHLNYLDLHFADGRNFVMGDEYTVADAYVFAISRWLPAANLTLQSWPALEDYVNRISLRPATLAALEAEGINETV